MQPLGRKPPSIRQQLQLEIATRGVSAAAAFTSLGIAFLFYAFGRNLVDTYMRVTAFVIIVVGVIRFWVSRRASRAGVVTPGQYRVLTATIVINSLAWGFYFFLAHGEALYDGDSFFASYILLAGLSVASLVSISASSYFSQLFSLANVGGQLVLFTYANFFTDRNVDPAMLIFQPIFIVWLLREAVQFRRQLINRFKVQFRLETANRRLRRSREELVDQTARTVHASRLASLGEMAGGIAHEVNNPLAIIDLSLESFKITHAKIYGPLDERAGAILDRGQKAIRRISAIVKGLKNFSRAGDHDPLENVAIGQVIDDTLGLCAEKMKAHAVDLRVKGDRALTLHCRPIEIAQVLVNLINNAYDVVRDLPPAERFIHIESRSEGARVRISVRNGGPLIPDAVAEKLFQPFFTTKPPGQGTGLGLSVSHAIAQKHEGDLYLVAGTPRTTFVLELPLATAAQLRAGEEE